MSKIAGKESYVQIANCTNCTNWISLKLTDKKGFKPGDSGTPAHLKRTSVMVNTSAVAMATPQRKITLDCNEHIERKRCYNIRRHTVVQVTTVWHEIFAGFDFCDFFHNPQNKIPAKKLFPAKICYAKIYSTTEIIKITI